MWNEPEHRLFTDKEMLEQEQLDRIKVAIGYLDDVVENNEFELYPEELAKIAERLEDAAMDLRLGRMRPGAYRDEDK